MKAGWIAATLGEAFTTSTGSTPPKSNSDFYGQFMPLVKPPELLDSTIDSAEDGLSESGAQVARTLPPNSILVSCIGNLGKIGMNTVPVAFNQQINAIHPAPSTALPEFMFYQTLGGRFRGQLEAMASGTTVPIVNKSKFNSIEIVLPPLPEQQRIVTLLDEAFDGIATAKANAEKNLQNARAIFESHLQSVFAQRGEGWVEKTLEEIGKTQTGSTPNTSDRANYGNFISFVKPGDFKTDGTLDYDKDKLSENGAAGARIVPAGSVLMVCIGATIGKCGYSNQDVTTNQQVNALTPQDGSSNRFIYYQMLTEAFQRKVINASGQATLPIINKSKWSALSVWLPPKVNQQTAIATKFDAVHEATQRLEAIYKQKLIAFDDLKKSLLHRAFNGEL